MWHYALAWNRCSIEELSLTASPGNVGIAPNTAAPATIGVWNHPVDQPLDPLWYGDPNEKPSPIRMAGLRNGTYSGSFVVNSPKPIRGLAASAGELNGGAGKTIPSSAMSIGYALPHEKSTWNMFGGFDRLDTAVTNEIASLWWGREYPIRIQPVWVTVKIPRDAVEGIYRGAVTVSAGGLEPARIPVELEVVGGWTLPDPQDFVMGVGLLESPETVAGYYGVPMWSEAHWKHLDRVFAFMAELGNHEVYVPLVGKTLLDNTDSMVRWLKQADGTYRHDFSIAERYLDLAAKHFRPLHTVCLGVLNLTHYGERRATRYYTEVDTATGGASLPEAAKWGTPEARAFWKPAIDGMMAVLAKRGLDKVARFGIPCDYSESAGPCMDDMKTISPKTRWLQRSHMFPDQFQGIVDHYTCMLGNNLSVLWDPDPARFEATKDVRGYPTWWKHGVMRKPVYGWQENPYGDMIVGCFPRPKNAAEMNQTSPLPRYRIAAEGAMLSAMMWKETHTFRTLGSFGADFWRGWRYASYGDMGCMISWFVAPGREGPVHTLRSRMLQESLQDAEARMFVERALTDPALKAKLPPALATRIADACDARVRFFNYLTVYYNAAMREQIRVASGDVDALPKALPQWWNELNREIYALTDDVANALKR